MNNTFFEKSMDIANDFIQNIVFLDDKAFKDSDKENTDHDLDTLKISQVFANQNKICAVYRPESNEDIERFKIIADKADVVVVDWQIVFPQTVKDGEEEDDAPDDPRGIYTKEIIKSIISGENSVKNSLKIIIVYTGDYTILEDIANDIYENAFNSSESYILNNENCSIESSQVKVLVRAKNTEIAAEGNKERYGRFMIPYEDLPQFIIKEFSEITSGLLSNFALLSLTTLRKNSSKILGLFSKKTDSAYLGHKSIIPKQEDSEDLLIELFGDSVKDLLFYSKVNEELRDKLIEPWIDEKIEEDELQHVGHKVIRTKQMVKNILSSKIEKVKDRFVDAMGEVNPQLKNHLVDNPTKLFTNNSEMENVIMSDKGFAKLTHHKSLFIPKNVHPKLSLGCLIKSDKSEYYYICIQQRCDSVRIPKGTERKFLFLRLKESDDKFDILTPDGKKLKKDKDSFSIRTIKFVCQDDSGIIKAELNEAGKFIFKQMYNHDDDEQFEWILDLKDLHSQRIISDYTSSLSRVGLDESEWHRRFLS
jgi:hypothetical protein